MPFADQGDLKMVQNYNDDLQKAPPSRDGHQTQTILQSLQIKLHRIHYH